MVSLYLPSPEQLAPLVEEVANEFVQIATQGDEPYTLDELHRMVRLDAPSRAALALISQRASVALGNYAHPDPKMYKVRGGRRQTVTEWTRSNFQSMKGTFRAVIKKKIAQSFGLGYSATQILFSSNEPGFAGEWRLARLNTLDTKRVEFAGMKGQIDRIIYNSSTKGQLPLDYKYIIHLTNDLLESHPKGYPQAAAAYPFFKARQLLLKEWAIAGQRQATGLFVVQVPSNETVRLLNSRGKPLVRNGEVATGSAAEAVLLQAQDLGNNGVFVTDIKNRVMNLPQTAGENFFNLSCQYLQNQIFLCYGIPQTIFNEGSVQLGSAGVNAGHRLILDSFIEGLVAALKEELIEKVIRPLLTANFGIRDEFGDFQQEKFIDPTMAAGRASNIINALSMGVLENTDLAAVNRLRTDLGISELSQEEYDNRMVAKLANEQTG